MSQGKFVYFNLKRSNEIHTIYNKLGPDAEAATSHYSSWLYLDFAHFNMKRNGRPKFDKWCQLVFSKPLVQDSQECLAGRSLRSWPQSSTDSAWWRTIIPVVQSKSQESGGRIHSARGMVAGFISALFPQAGPELPPALGERLRSPACTNFSVEAKDPAGTQFVWPWFCSAGGRAHPGREVRH